MSRAYKGVEDVHILVAQTTVKFFSQHDIDRPDHEVDTLHGRNRHYPISPRERDGSFEKLLIERLDDGLFAFEVIDLAEHTCAHCRRRKQAGRCPCSPVRFDSG